MKYVLAALLGGIAAPGLAQHTDHGAPVQPAPAAKPACTPEHAAMGHCTLPPVAPQMSPRQGPSAGQAAPAGYPNCAPEHAAMGHCKPSAATPSPGPSAGQVTSDGAPTCTPEHAAMGHCKRTAATPPPGPAAGQVSPGDPTCTPEHAAMGHCKPAAVPRRGSAAGQVTSGASADPHAGHNMVGGQPSAALPPVGPPPAAAFEGPEHAQDLFYERGDAAKSRRDLIREHGGLTAYRIFIDQAELAVREGREGYSFDAQAWYGGDINKLWVKTEGEGTFGEAFEGAEVQALWSLAIDPWFDAQFGVRQDFQSGPDRTYLVAGIQGLAPYWFEVEGALFLSNKGDLTARFEGEYDLRLTQSLILQPRAEFNLALQDVRELGIGSGLSTAEVGARLRYQILPSSGPAEISPYLGIQYERAFSETARFRRLAHDDVGGWSFLVGLRTWF